ncbi:hypothetical protein SAMN04489732_101491 [Amycolatopsis saalfeldensis]|uniref:Major Facilitator Superfamily protein n=1 Tax=Amycolatopsis saalfeldensis TaxID=394193 RepID=A0A1H8QTU8_9PSEU|nr:hypothetical protein SAMN04489732_101491 [Amycolatopsis saalfeldensis]
MLFTNLASIMVGFAIYAMALSFPQLLQAPSSTGYGLGRTMVEAGLCLAPNGLVMMLLSPVSARLTNRYGARTTLMTGAVVIALGYVFAILLMDNALEMMRSVGTSTSSAVMATMLAQLTITAGGLTWPSLTGFRATFAVAAVGLGFTALVPRARAATAREPVAA